MSKDTLIESIYNATAFDSTYERGYDLAESGSVDIIDIEERKLPHTATITARVDGTSYPYYTTMVLVNLDADKLVSYSCTCPAHMEYDGMCKHAVATALEYVEAVRSADGLRKPEPITSYAIEDLMSRYAAEAAYASEALAQSEAFEPEDGSVEPVDITCTIELGAGSYSNRYYDRETWSLGLRVSRGKTSYVAKHVDEVVDAWRRGVLYSYGKNLSFVHRPAAFTDYANRVLEALAPIVDAQWALHVARDNRYYSQPNLTTKTLPLSTAQLGSILDLSIGKEVEIENFGGGYGRGGRRRAKGKKRGIPVVDGAPSLEVVIEAGQMGGYDLAVPNGAVECLRARERVYLVASDGVFRCGKEFSAEMGAFCASLLPAREQFHIREADMAKFCASVLPALRKHTRLSAPENLWGLMPPEAEFEFRIGEVDGYITCQAVVIYDGRKLDLFEPVLEGQPVRHVAREIAAQHVVGQFFPGGEQRTPNYALPGSDWRYEKRPEVGPWEGKASEAKARFATTPLYPWFRADDDMAYYLLFTEGLHELSKLGDVLLSNRLRGVEVRSAPSIRVDASVKSGLLDLTVESPDLDPAELVAYLASYRRKQRYVRLSNGDIVMLDGSVGALSDLADGLGVKADALVEGVESMPANRTLFVDAILKRAGGVRFTRDEGFRAIVRDFETVADADYVAPPAVRDVLRPYQTEGFKWLCTLGKIGFGGILADDMGLGKTLQMIAYFLHERESGDASTQAMTEGGGAAGVPDSTALASADASAAEGASVTASSPKPALVVCPASLVYNWVAEIGRFAPELGAVALVGSKRARRDILASASSYDVVVTSYDLMKRDIDDIEPIGFSCAVLDEAQYIKNSSTKAAKSAKRLNADVRFALTGTPIENRLTELWSIFDFLMPGVLGSSDSFSKRFATPIASKEEGAARRLQSLVGPFILRRLKSEVLRDLPDRDENVVLANMEGEQQKLYRATSDKLALTLAGQMPEEFASSKLQILAELTKLRQICCDPSLLYENYAGGSAKLETCMELVRSALEGGHAILLFSQFTTMLDIIAERLDAERVAYFMLTGATSKEERARLVELFQAGEAPVFLISLKAGGVGLNLTAADVVIHYDPWWNLAAQNQATDRAHRIGQTRNVSVFKLIAKNTIEEKIVEMQESKRDLAESVLGGEVVSAATITRDDLLALLEA